MKKFLLGLTGTVIVGALLWTALFFTVPQVKDWTLHDVLKIERTLEDENLDPGEDIPPEDNGENNENNEEDGDDYVQPNGPGGTKPEPDQPENSDTTEE